MGLWCLGFGDGVVGGKRWVSDDLVVNCGLNGNVNGRWKVVDLVNGRAESDSEWWGMTGLDMARFGRRGRVWRQWLWAVSGKGNEGFWIWALLWMGERGDTRDWI